MKNYVIFFPNEDVEDNIIVILMNQESEDDAIAEAFGNIGWGLNEPEQMTMIRDRYVKEDAFAYISEFKDNPVTNFEEIPLRTIFNIYHKHNNISDHTILPQEAIKELEMYCDIDINIIEVVQDPLVSDSYAVQITADLGGDVIQLLWTRNGFEDVEYETFPPKSESLKFF